MDEREFTEALRQQLVEAAERRALAEEPHRRGWVRWSAGLVAAAMLAVVFVGVGTLRDDQVVAADVDIRVAGESLVLELRGRDVSSAEIVEAAKEAGLDVTVSEVPVGPSNVGRLVNSTASELPPVLEAIGADGRTFLGFRIPKDWPGTLGLTLGRAALPGEPFAVASDALQPGEPLACRELMGRDLAEVATELRAEEFTVRTFVLPTPGEVQDPAAHPDADVVQIDAVSPDEVWINATIGGVWMFPGEPPTLSPEC